MLFSKNKYLIITHQLLLLSTSSNIKGFNTTICSFYIKTIILYRCVCHIVVIYIYICIINVIYKYHPINVHKLTRITQMLFYPKYNQKCTMLFMHFQNTSTKHKMFKVVPGLWGNIKTGAKFFIHFFIFFCKSQ